MHKPVLLNEAIKILDPRPGNFVIDGTVDGGGHALQIMKKIGPGGILLALDLDQALLRQFQERVRLEKLPVKVIAKIENFKNMKQILQKENLGKADGVILDLGFSSEQIEHSGRGFSFLRNEPLDMRYCADNDHDNNYDNNNDYNANRNITAAEAVNTFSENALAEIFKKYGEERYAGFIAKKIIERRKRARIITTLQLSQLVHEVYRSHRHGHPHGQHRIHPATRTFQALRIFVNQELENLKKFLEDLPDLLLPGGRAAVVSFHSLEDRLVKHAFRSLAQGGGAELLVKKPIQPSLDEIRLNPRSRSARLRAIRFL